MRLVIIGAGFAGMYAALSAARLRDIQGVSPEQLEIALVAPEPTLVVRPAALRTEARDTDGAAAGRPQGHRRRLRARQRRDDRHQLPHGGRSSRPRARRTPSPTIAWSWPPAAGCSVRIFRASPSTASASTSLDDAIALDKHLHRLADRPAVNGRDTVVVAGGGFTGIEAATEMPSRLREILGKDAKHTRHHRRSQQGDRT